MGNNEIDEDVMPVFLINGFWKLEKPSFWNLPWTRNTSRQREKHF